MAGKKVAVFGASGVQGRLQVHELQDRGYSVRAISRTKGAFDKPRYKDLEVVAADYDDPASIDNALAGIDVVFAQPFSMGDERMLAREMEGFANALAGARTPLMVFNTSMWAPRKPTGCIGYDVILEIEQMFEDRNLPYIAFEPTLFMNNLLGSWIKNTIVNDHVFRYPHKPTMEADWICLEDVARYMVAAIERPDLIGKKIRIGGPDRLKPADVIAVLSDVTGRPVTHHYITPHDFAQGLWDLYNSITNYEENGGNLPRGKTEKQYVDGIDTYYTFCNDAPERPFVIDQAELDRTISIPRTSMLQWARQQDWTA